MKYLFAILLLLHGLIHLMGFAKAFGYAQISQLTREITKPWGAVWLIAAIAFVISAILYLSKNDSWWMLAIVGILISQLLIILYWTDARYGTLANVIVLLVAIPEIAHHYYENQYKKEVVQYLSLPITESLLTVQSISHLPEPVQRYITFSGAIDKPIPHNFKLTFEGQIRQDENSAWMPFTTEQYNFIDPPTRLFFMNAIMKRLPVAGYHSFKNGNASMDIRLLSLFQVQYQEGEKMNVAETVTWFNDLCLYAPGALIDKRITWVEIDSLSARAIFTMKDITISATLYFSEKGELINFTSNDRYRIVDKEDAQQILFSTPIKNYVDINGHRVPYDGKAIWSLPTGDLTYGEFYCTHIQYNVKD